MLARGQAEPARSSAPQRSAEQAERQSRTLSHCHHQISILTPASSSPLQSRPRPPSALRPPLSAPTHGDTDGQLHPGAFASAGPGLAKGDACNAASRTAVAAAAATVGSCQPRIHCQRTEQRGWQSFCVRPPRERKRSVATHHIYHRPHLTIILGRRRQQPEVPPAAGPTTPTTGTRTRRRTSVTRRTPPPQQDARECAANTTSPGRREPLVQSGEQHHLAAGAHQWLQKDGQRTYQERVQPVKHAMHHHSVLESRVAAGLLILLWQQSGRTGRNIEDASRVCYGEGAEWMGAQVARRGGAARREPDAGNEEQRPASGSAAAGDEWPQQ